MMKKSHRFAFTMVEILAVTAIISILAAIGFGSYSYAMGRAKESATRALVKQLEAGIAAFHAKYGYYPPVNNFGTITVTRNDSDNVVQAICFVHPDDENKPDNEQTKSYMLGYTAKNEPSNARQKRFKEAELAIFMKAVDFETVARYIPFSEVKINGKKYQRGQITDAYGGTIYYRAPGAINTTRFDLIAPGEDGYFGEVTADTKRTTPSDTKSDYIDSSNDWICDDIANF